MTRYSPKVPQPHSELNGGKSYSGAHESQTSPYLVLFSLVVATYGAFLIKGFFSKKIQDSNTSQPVCTEDFLVPIG